MLGRKQRILSVLLALAMVFTLASSGYAASLGAGPDPEKSVDAARNLLEGISEEQRDAYETVKRDRRARGLVNLEEAFGTGGEPVTVIVEFVHRPPAVEQIALAAEENEYISVADAQKLADADHAEFEKAFAALFGSRDASSSAEGASAAGRADCGITHTYRDALNGVAVRIPADRVGELLDIDCVYAVYPDVEFTAEPPDAAEEDSSDSLPVGMADERAYLGIDRLHAAGITGQGITVGVIDTGVDYHHPDLAGAFAPYRGEDPEGSLLEIDGLFYGRNFVYDHLGSVNKAFNDPMETTWEEWLTVSELWPEYNEGTQYYTSHGTHVAGTVLGRGVTEDSTRGVAPEASLIAYRALGPYGNGMMTFILSALDYVGLDGCDVVNMSLGLYTNDPYFVTSLAVNNLVLTYGIVFAVSAGNYGDAFSTVGTPGTATLAITVANGTSRKSSERLLFAEAGDGEAVLYQVVMDGSGIVANGDGTYAIDNGRLVPDAQNRYRLVPVPPQDGSGVIGIGAQEDYTPAVRSEVSGNIAVIMRGQTFVDSARYAREAGAGAVLVINGQDRGIAVYAGESDEYAPLFVTETYEAGMKLLEYAGQNGSCITLSGVTHAGGQLNNSSSRGPSARTYEIKPDIVAPGTNVLSCVPYYIHRKVTEGQEGWESRYEGARASYTGTSMSSPAIAGIAALMMDYSRGEGINGGLGWDRLEIKARIMNSAETLGIPADPVLSLSASSAVLQRNESLNVSASFNRFAEDLGYDPALIEWSLSGDPVGQLSAESGAETTFVSGDRTGRALITATARKEGQPDISASCAVEVTVSVTGVSLDKAEITVVDGMPLAGIADLLTLRATVEPADAENQDLVWTVSNNDFLVEIVDQGDGSAVVTGYGNYMGEGGSSFTTWWPNFGRATVTVTTRDGGHTATAVVNVLKSDPQVELESRAVLEHDGSMQPAPVLSATAEYYGYRPADWSSSNTDIVTVDEHGVVTAAAPGTATITVRCEAEGRAAIEASCEVRVLEADQPALMLNRYTHTLVHGTVDSSVRVSMSRGAQEAGYAYSHHAWSEDWETLPEVDVDGEGVVTFTMGDAEALFPKTLTVYYANGADTISVGLSVRFRPPVTLSSRALTLLPGESKTLTASITYFMRSNGFDPVPVWASDSPAVTVTQDGRVTAISETSEPAVVTATVYDGNGASVSTACEVTVLADGPDRAPKALPDAGIRSLEPVNNPISREVGYSVYEVGAGYVNPVSAMYARGYVTTDTSFARLGSDFTTVLSEDRTASLSFGVVKAGNEADKTLGGIVHTSPGARFALSCEFNRAGRQVMDPEGLFEMTMPGEVTADASGRAAFDVSIRSVGLTGEEDVGSYEGYITLTNTEDPSERYSVPFALYVRSSVPVLNESFLFLNKPVISTGEQMQLGGSAQSHLYFMLNYQGDSIRFGIVGEEHFDRFDDESVWLGESGFTYDITDIVPGSQTRAIALGGVYVVWNNDGSGMMYVLQPGVYKLVAAVQTSAGTEYSDIDFIVDNQAPVCTIDQADPENPNLVEYTATDAGKTTLTGSIYDDGVELMNELGITFDIYHSEGDVHGRHPDQSYNALVAKVGDGAYIRADIDAQGNFTLPLTGLKAGGDTTVTLYALDNFTVNYIEFLSEIVRGFHPEKPCYMELYEHNGFYGTNMDVRDITLRQTGPAMSVSTYGRTLNVGETLRLEVAFNDPAVQAGCDTLESWVSDNPEVASVGPDGLVTALKTGAATITATSNGPVPLTASCEILVVGLSDGIKLPVGGILNMGETLHPTSFADGDSGRAIKDDPNEYGTYIRAMEWTVMGRELYEDGSDDGYLTVMSTFGIDSLPFGFGDSYNASQIRAYLNGQFYDETLTGLEQSMIPKFSVYSGIYDEEENLIEAERIDNQSLYLPWGTVVPKGDSSLNTVFWSAGGDVIDENAVIRHAEIPDELFYNRLGLNNKPIDYGYPSVSYYLRNPSLYGSIGMVDKDGYVTNSPDTEVLRGIRPITKLDTSKVVFSMSCFDYYRSGLDTEFTDDTNQHIRSYGGEHFKLTIQGANEGADLGGLGGIDASDRQILQGKNVTVGGLQADRTGYDYRIGYKVVGTVNGERTDVRYNLLPATATSIDLDTSSLSAGEYKVYVWLQKMNDGVSHEAGTVYTFNLDVLRRSSVPAGLSDGVSLQKGDYVYYSAFDHSTGSSSAEGVKSPVLWRFTGIEEGRKEQYWTMLSEYVLTNRAFGSLYGKIGFDNSAVNRWLNTSFLDEGFTEGENTAVPFYTVKTSTYEGDSIAYGNTAFNQRVYLPWVWYDYITIDWGVYGYMYSSVYWSAGDLRADSSLASPRIDNMPGLPAGAYAEQKATYKNGVAATQLMRTHYYDTVDYIMANGRGDDLGSGLNTRHGIRPVTKLIPDAVLYASLVSETPAAGQTQADANYRTPIDGANHYKLTVLGGNGGADVGELGGIPEGTMRAVEGGQLRLDGISASQTGADHLIAWKVVGGPREERAIVAYGEAPAGADSLPLSLEGVPAGEYDVYVWLQKNNEINSHEAGVVETFALTVEEASSAAATITASPRNIVESLAAYVRLDVAGENLAGCTLQVRIEDAQGNVFAAFDNISEGKNRIFIDAAPLVPEDTEYTVRLTGTDPDGRSIPEATDTLVVLKYRPELLWSASKSVVDGNLGVRFNARAVKSAKHWAVKVDGKAAAGDFVDDTTLRINRAADDVNYEACEIEVKGVVYPDYFPSYSFTFRVR